MAHVDKLERQSWRSVSLSPTATGLTAREQFERFRVEAMTEMALRVAGILLIAMAILTWFLLPVDTDTGQMMSYGGAASMMAAGGLAVFAYGTRGFRRQISLDLQEGTLSLTKININDQARIARQIDLGEIESVFLRRPATQGGLATLLVRIKGGGAPAIALSGDTAELEAVHRELCDVMRIGQGVDTGGGPRVRLHQPAGPKRRLFSA